MKWQEKNTRTDPVTQSQSSKTRDADASPDSPAKEIQIFQRKQSGNYVASFLPSSPKKTDGMPSGHSIMRRRRSSEGLTDEPFTGTRVINFTSRGEHVVHCGKCLGEFGFRQFIALYALIYFHCHCSCEKSCKRSRGKYGRRHRRGWFGYGKKQENRLLLIIFGQIKVNSLFLQIQGIPPGWKETTLCHHQLDNSQQFNHECIIKHVLRQFIPVECFNAHFTPADVFNVSIFVSKALWYNNK